MNPLPLKEKEYRQGLYRIERQAIIPLKWVMLVVLATLWYWVIGFLPTADVFLVFCLYFLFACGQTYFFFFSHVTVRQIRPLVLFSYFIDVAFVAMIIYFDLATTKLGGRGHHDFYLLYFLLVMRGFALFKSVTETVIVNLLLSSLFIFTFLLQPIQYQMLFDRNFTVSLVLIWLVMLMSWFVVSTITRQKMELLDVHDRLLRADNLARVGELAAGVAHEINTPMGIIAATAEYLKKTTDPADERLEDLESIYREAMRCKDIVQEMLTYANPRPVGSSAIDLRALNDEVLHFVFPRHKQNTMELIREYDDEIGSVSADPNLIKQALLNLYINARQAIPKEQPGRIISRIQSRHRGRAVMIEIEDNGPGIKSDDAERIFEPFFTRKADGTGLGLAVTQRIVEMFDGNIAVRQAAPCGAIFTLTFPAQ